jgi:hypothetical protein
LAVFLGGALGVLGAKMLAPTAGSDTAQADPRLAKALDQLDALTTQVQNLEQKSEADIAAEANTRATEISAIQARLEALAAQAPEPANGESTLDSASQAALAALGSRISDLEARPIPVAGDGSEGAVVDLAPIMVRLATLESNTDKTVDLSDLASLTELQALEARIATLENADTDGANIEQIQALQSRLAALETSEGVSTTKAQRAMVMADLKLAAQGEKPFAVAFAKTRLQFGASKALDQLSPVAGIGAPNLPELSAQLKTLIPTLLREDAKPADDASMATKAGAALRSLVSVRRTDGKGEGLQAELAHAETALQEGDLGTAIAIVSSLQGPAAVAAKAWLTHAKNRQIVLESLDLLEREQAAGGKS